jgi:hypothetical protein
LGYRKDDEANEIIYDTFTFWAYVNK